MLRVRLLGGLALDAGDGPVEPPASRRAQALLAWLALHPGAQARATIAGRFWPDGLDSSARANLRSAVHGLRQALGACGREDQLVASRESLALDAEPGLWVDVLAFEALLDEGRLEKALELYRGDLAPALEDEWLHAEREAYRERMLDARARLAAQAEAAGDLPRAIALTREHIAVDALSESAHRDLMRRLAAGGDRPAALAAYERLGERLRSELGLAPARATRELAEELRSEPSAPPAERPASAEQARLPLPPTLRATGPFVGRAEDLAVLHAALDRALEGEQEIVMLAGEPGVGKSRLAAELAGEAHTRGVRVLYGRCDEEAVIPYQPITELLRHYVAHAPEDELRRFASPLIARLVPALKERLPDLDDPPPLEPRSERYLVFDAVAKLLAGVGSLTGSLVVLDDVHWADPETVLLFRFLSYHPGPVRRLVVATYRDSDIALEHPAVALIAELGGKRMLQQCTLAGLDADRTGELVDALAGSASSPELRRAVHVETAGNPFFAVELVRHLDETGELTAAGDGAGVPDTVRTLVEQRIARLGPEVRPVLTVAAVAGQRFELDVVEAAGGGEATADALDVAVGAGLLHEDGELPGRYAFAHALVRETLLDGLTAMRRARLHGAVGEAIERLRTDNLDGSLSELAHHFALAAMGSADRAVDYAERAGRQSAAQLSYEDAAAHFASALSLLDRSSTPDPARRCDLLLALGAAQGRAGRPEEGRETHRRAAAEATAIGDPERLARAALGFGGEGLAGVWWHEVGAADEALVALLESALRALDDADRPLRARLLARLASERLWAGELDELERLSVEALDMARRLNDPPTLAFALTCRALAISDPERLPERAAIAEELVEVADGLNERELQMMAHGLRMACALATGARDAFDEGVEARAQIAAEVPHPLFRWYATTSRALAAHLDGRFDEAERLYGEALEMGRQVQAANAAQAYAGQLLTLRYDQGRLDELAAVADEYAARYARSPHWRCALALVLAETGRADDARRELDALGAGGGFRALPRGTGWLMALDFAAKAAVLVGGTEHDATLLELLSPLADRLVLIGMGTACSGAVATTLSNLARVAGAADDARAYAERGLLVAERMRSAPLLAHATAAHAAARLAAPPAESTVP